MSKPLGYYLDPVLDWAHDLTPLKDWLATVALVTLAATVALWMFSFIPLTLLFWPDFDGDNGFGRIYLASVAVWVIPAAVLAACSHLRRRRHGAAT